MNKIISTIAGIAVLGIALTACGKPTTVAGTVALPPVTVTAAPVTVTQAPVTVTKVPAPVTKSVTVTERQTVQQTITQAPAAPAEVTIEGTQDLVGADNWTTVGGVCSGTGGYDDLKSGASVNVTTSNGNKLAIGALGDGVPSGTTCEFKFEVKLPGGPGPFFVEITRRGALQADKITETLYVFGGTLGS